MRRLFVAYQIRVFPALDHPAVNPGNLLEVFRTLDIAVEFAKFEDQVGAAAIQVQNVHEFIPACGIDPDMLFLDRVMTATALKSTAISDATMLKQSIYEVVRSEMTRATYDRAKQSMDAVGREVETMIHQAWGRS